MKKILLFLVALVATLGMNAQTTEIYKGAQKEATYSGADVKVIFSGSGDNSRITVYQDKSVAGAFTGSEYKVVSKELPPSTGTAKRKGDFDVNWVQLWKDGPKFADYNVGAENNKATDYGYYLAWGGSSNKNATYNTGSAVLSGSDDSAYNLWGEHWRMPTLAEIQSLDNNCSTTWYDGQEKKYNGSTVPGYLITGTGDYSSNSIFLPAAGNYDGSKVSSVGTSGRYWSSAPNGSDANQLYISADWFTDTKYGRSFGCSVRPVYVEDLVAVTGVSLNKTELKVGVGNTETLSATVTPENATNKKVLWTSSNEAVATIDSYGKVTGVSLGNTTITATTEDGSKTATCAVTVVTPTTGYAKATIGGTEVDVNWVQLWKDGPKFAEYNVGVTNGKAEGYGGYYCWGKTKDKDPDNNYNGSESPLTGTDDTATNLWGNNWRMPTKAELEALLSSCDVEWIDGSTKKYNNTTVVGLLCKGKDAYASNSLFLPAAGYSGGGTFFSQGVAGYYWSSTNGKDSMHAYDLFIYFHDNKRNDNKVGDVFRRNGHSVRAVLAK